MLYYGRRVANLKEHTNRKEMACACTKGPEIQKPSKCNSTHVIHLQKEDKKSTKFKMQALTFHGYDTLKVLLHAFCNKLPGSDSMLGTRVGHK